MDPQQIYIDLKLHDIVIALPWQLNNELYLHLKQNLRYKIEKKNIDIGYICKVTDIVDYKDGYLLPEDFTGNGTFKVTYNAKVCVVIPNTQIICKINNMVTQLITARNGPVVVIIKQIDINQNLFKINNTGNIVYIKTGKQLDSNDHIKITVKSRKILNNDVHINVVGFLEDIVTSDVASEYMFKDYDDDNDEVKPNVIKYTVMNEDEGIGEEETEPASKIDNTYIMDI